MGIYERRKCTIRVRPFVMPQEGEEYKETRPASKGWYELGIDKYEKYIGYYQKYFGHLTGVVMVPRGSVVPLCLGGADFDGDLVSVIFDDNVVEAVKKGCYKKTEWNSEEFGKRDFWKRTLPVIKIPGVVANKETVPKKVPYEHIEATFSTSIGYLSNAAIKIGQLEYGKACDIILDRNGLACWKCTILTGLDIDAAKNGSHPDLSSFVDSVKSIPNAPYLKFKKDFDKLRKNSKYIFDKLKIEDDEREKKFVISVSGIDKNVEYSSENRNYGTGINRLPIIFQDELVKYKEKKHKRRETCNPFNELQDKDDDLLIKEYTDKCNAVFDRYNWYRGFVKELAGQSDAQDKLDKQIFKTYDDSENGATKVFEYILPELMVKLDKAIPNETNIEEIMERINKFKWQFQPYNNRADVLEKIIGNDFNAECLSDEEKELLYHFGHYGFKRLWYILSVIKESRFLPYVKMREEYVEKQRNKKKADNEEIAELRDYELEKLTRKYYEENLTNIQSRIYNICLTQLSDIIKNSEISDESKINHLYKMTEGNEKKRRFFWDVFSWEELEKCLDTKGV